MKKTVTVNISGIVFTIDEDAYEMLQNYLKKIKSYFSKSEGRDEIIEDIEARIAEMFQEKLDTNLQVVTIADVEEVIVIMGKPEDFIDDESQAENTEDNSDNHNKKSYKTKRLYRDGEGKVLGGVCSGIGYYFGFDPIWLRLAFAGMFFFGGTGILFYILLWMVIPEAKTTAEKLEMKGENVNIDTIGKVIEEEMENLKNKFSEGAGSWKNRNHDKIGNFFHRLFDFIFSILSAVIKFFGKIFGVVLIIIGASLLFPVMLSFFNSSEIFISWTTSGITTLPVHHIINAFFGSQTLASVFFIGIGLFIGVPAAAILYGGIRLLFGIKNHFKPFSIALTSIWIISLFLLAYSGYKIALEFNEKEYFTETTTLDIPSDTLNLDVSKDVFVMSNIKRYYNHDETFELLKIDENITYNGDVELNIEPTSEDTFKIEITTRSRGKSKSEARENAKEINYNYTIENNSVVFDPYFTMDSNSKIRAQEIDITIYVPKGKSIYLSKDILRILYNADNFTNTLDRKMINKTWTATQRGLECIGCNENEL